MDDITKAEIIEEHWRLMTVRHLTYEIIRKTWRVEELRRTLLPGGMGYSADRVQASPSDKLAKVMDKIIPLEQEIDGIRAAKVEAIARLSREIEQIDDDRCRTILDGYYLSGRSIEEIAEQIGYSVKHTYRLRKVGLQKLRQMRIPTVVY